MLPFITWVDDVSVAASYHKCESVRQFFYVAGEIWGISKEVITLDFLRYLFDDGAVPYYVNDLVHKAGLGLN